MIDSTIHKYIVILYNVGSTYNENDVVAVLRDMLV